MPGLTELRARPLARDVAVVLVWFVVLAVLSAVLWWQLTPLAEYTRTATNAEMGEEQLARQVSADGWYVTIAAVGGLLSGVGLLAWRRRDPVLMVVLVTLGSLLCAWLVLRIGLWLGPPDPTGVLRHVKVGAKVPMRLEPKASGVIYVWPITALLGAIGVIWGTEDRRADPVPSDQTAGDSDVADDHVDVGRSG